MKKIIKYYLHGDKEYNREVAEEEHLSEDATENFIGCCYEVELDLEVDTETGHAEIVAVNGVKLSQE